MEMQIMEDWQLLALLSKKCIPWSSPVGVRPQVRVYGPGGPLSFVVLLSQSTLLLLLDFNSLLLYQPVESSDRDIDRRIKGK
jgi:hypothetical protein